MPQRSTILTLLTCATALALVIARPFRTKSQPKAQPKPAVKKPADDFAVIKSRFDKRIQPLLKKLCFDCHNADEMTSGIRVDHLTGAVPEKDLFLWRDILKQVSAGKMPPKEADQPTKAQRKQLVEWIQNAMRAAISRDPQKNGSIRRLTRAQYRNTLRDLLGIDDNLADVLPPDAVSKDGFLNNGSTLELSPLLVEAYFNIAEKALDRAIVDETAKPVIQSFRMDLGRAINKQPCPDKLILGANSLLLENRDFRVTQVRPKKPFAYTPFAMRTKFRYIEGYRGNATVRGWREFDGIYHNVFACMRGTRGYPKGAAYETVPGGLLLRPAIPSPEIFKQSSTYGPNANFKISLRELPDFGRFRVRVKAAKYDDALLLDRTDKPQPANANAVTLKQPKEKGTVTLQSAGVYQVDVHGKPAGKKRRRNAGGRNLTLTFNGRRFTKNFVRPAFIAVRLPAGQVNVETQFNGTLERIVFTPLKSTDDIAKRFAAFEKRTPKLGVHVGFRRDCGSTCAPVQGPREVKSTRLQEFVFEGTITNYPSPDVEKDNVNYLAGIREIAVRSEYTDGRDRPRLRIRSIEFEGPFYETWPPKSHRRIFIDSKSKAKPAVHAREILRSFATRAFRRPVTKEEEATLFKVWKEAYSRTSDSRASIKDALLVTLTSPQFLFQIETSDTPKPEPLTEYELASKLSYFLWNSAPDARLLRLAKSNSLKQSLDGEIDRMIADARFRRFGNQFVSQWLSLDKFDVLEVDRKKFPNLTRDTRARLRLEPIRFVEHLIRNNRPASELIAADYLLADETVAAYYGLADKTESGFRFVPIRHGQKHLGGLLSHAAILAGLSDGREPNPVKRGAWFARKIIADPPDDPPPNVPALPEKNEKKLSLRERLERHRNQEGCRKCHAGIDPWGVPFEQFDAAGLFKTEKVDARSTLPDDTTVNDFLGLRSYLVRDRMDRVAYSFLYHTTTYAVGRRLTYNEIESLKKAAKAFRSKRYRLRDMIRFVVKSPIFQEK